MSGTDNVVVAEGEELNSNILQVDRRSPANCRETQRMQSSPPPGTGPVAGPGTPPSPICYSVGNPAPLSRSCPAPPPGPIQPTGPVTGLACPPGPIFCPGKSCIVKSPVPSPPTATISSAKPATVEPPLPGTLQRIGPGAGRGAPRVSATPSDDVSGSDSGYEILEPEPFSDVVREVDNSEHHATDDYRKRHI